MEEAAKKIIVFKAFDTVMEGNLAKTKLDAYGIPCFLTEENFTSIYPIRNNVFPGVRLHIFEQDYEQADEILQDSPFETEPTLCPKCQSKKVMLEDSNKVSGWNLISVVFFVAATFTGGSSGSKKFYHCNDCNNEWE